MRARESFYGASELERVRAEIRRARRAEWFWTVLTVLTLLGLVELCGWLLSCVKGAAVPALPLMPLAMAPVTEGSLMGLGVFAVAVVVCLLLHQWADYLENKTFCDDLREREKAKRGEPLELQDPFAGITDGLDGDEMHRILVSVAAEAREIQRIMARAWSKSDDVEQIEMVSRASEKMTFLVHCVEALCARLQPEITEPETTILTGRAKV